MLWIISAIVIMLLILFLLNFYKDPKRTMPKGSNIVAPADGRIINIINTSKNNIKIKKNIFGKIKTLTSDVEKECHVISIFMSPIDAHINRAPIEGIVKSIKYKKARSSRLMTLKKAWKTKKMR